MYVIPLKFNVDNQIKIQVGVNNEAFPLSFGTIETVTKLPDGATYEGACTIVPKTCEQCLPTALKFMKEDVVVTPIPYHEVKNTANGMTVTIGE